VRQSQVEDDEIGTPGPCEGERVGAAAGGRDLESGALEIVPRDLRDPRLIVHDQDVLHVKLPTSDFRLPTFDFRPET